MEKASYAKFNFGGIIFEIPNIYTLKQLSGTFYDRQGVILYINWPSLQASHIEPKISGIHPLFILLQEDTISIDQIIKNFGKHEIVALCDGLIRLNNEDIYWERYALIRDCEAVAYIRCTQKSTVSDCRLDYALKNGIHIRHSIDYALLKNVEEIISNISYVIGSFEVK